MPERIPIAPLSFEGYYGVGKGLAQVFEPYDPNKKLQGDIMRKQLAEFDRQKKAQALAQPKLADSWRQDTNRIVQEYNAISPRVAKQLAAGEISLEEASVLIGSESEKYNQLAAMTVQQRTVSEEAVKLINGDKEGIYNKEESLRGIDIWANPQDFLDDPIVRAQMEAVGYKGEGQPTIDQIVEFRNQNEDYIRPKLAYYHEKYTKATAEGLKPQVTTEPKWVTLPGSGQKVLQNVSTKKMPYQDMANRTKSQFTQALNGDNYKAVKWSAQVKKRVDDNLVIAENGDLELTAEGNRLLNKAVQFGLYDPATHTADGLPGTPDNMRNMLYVAAGVDEYEDYIEREEKATLQLQRNVNNNIRIGGGPNDKTKAGYFVTQTQAISELQNSPDWRGLQTEFNTPEKRKTQAYADRLWNMLGQYGKMSVKSDNGYLGYKVPLKTLGEPKNRVESANDLQYQETLEDGSIRWVPMGLEGEVSGLELTRGDIAWGYMEGGTWKVADKGDILKGKVSATDLRPITVFQYKLPDQKEKAPKNTGTGISFDADGKIITSQEKESVVIDSDTVKKAREKAKGNPIRRIYPLVDRAVASSLDASFSPAGSYRQDRGAGAGNPYQNPAVTITTEEVDDAFNVD